MEVEDFFPFPKPTNFLTKLVSLPADLIHNTMASLFSSEPSYHTIAQETKENAESSIQQAPPHMTRGSTLLQKLGLGFLSAAYACMVLFLVLVLAVLLGVGLVRLWVEEPVYVKENVYFDYTDAHPSAVFSFDGVNVGGYGKGRKIAVPVGHAFDVSLMLLMPESDFNRDLGVFQLTAELLSVNGNVIAISSQPSMLRFRSSPVRLARTVMMGLPLVLGISGETQKLNVQILRHKEGITRTKAIRATLHPRAGTSLLPQIYEAEIVVRSHLPWVKELVRNWKWTFYVWVSLYVYILLLMFLLCCYRPILFLVTPDYFFGNQRTTDANGIITRSEEIEVRELGDDESEASELLKKWRRSKRKAILHGHGDSGVTDTIGSSASSFSMATSTTTREDVTSVAVEEEDFEDSESVCLG